MLRYQTYKFRASNGYRAKNYRRDPWYLRYRKLKRSLKPANENLNNASDDDYRAALQEPTFGFSFLEKLLLMLIRGHPVKDGRTDLDRLKDAIYAVRGAHPGRGQKEIFDEPVLLQMAAQDYRAHGIVIKIDPKVLGEAYTPPAEVENITELARTAAKEFGLIKNLNQDRAVTTRLVNKFKRRRRELVGTLRYGSAIPHVLEFGVLERISAELKWVGVKHKLPDGPAPF